MINQIQKLICFAFLACTAKIAVAQDEPELTGMVPCPTNSSLMGYTNTTALNLDIIAHVKHLFDGNDPPDFYHYVLCPETTFNIAKLDSPFGGQQDGMDPIIPGLSNTIISCGEDGMSTNNCIMKGGDVHFYFPDFVIAKEVFLAGITFESVEGASIYGDAHPASHVNFVDCHWRLNKGSYTIYVHYTPTEEERRLSLEQGEPYDMNEMREIMRRDLKALPKAHESRDLQAFMKFSMSCIFVDSSLKQNSDVMATLFNLGGAVELVNTSFEENDVAELSVFTVLANGHALIHQNTSFTNNFARLGPVFVDSTSFLHLSRDNAGISNAGSMCNGIFLEDDASFCFDRSERCTGDCCEFGDETCDLYDNDNPSAAPSLAPKTDAPNAAPVPPTDPAPNPAPVPASPTPPTNTNSDTQTSSSASASTNTRPSGKGDVCGGFCSGFAAIIAVLVVIVLVLVIMVVRKRRMRRDQPATVTTASELEEPPELDDKSIT